MPYKREIPLNRIQAARCPVKDEQPSEVSEVEQPRNEKPDLHETLCEHAAKHFLLSARDELGVPIEQSEQVGRAILKRLMADGGDPTNVADYYRAFIVMNGEGYFDQLAADRVAVARKTQPRPTIQEKAPSVQRQISGLVTRYNEARYPEAKNMAERQLNQEGVDKERARLKQLSDAELRQLAIKSRRGNMRDRDRIEMDAGHRAY